MKRKLWLIPLLVVLLGAAILLSWQGVHAGSSSFSMTRSMMGSGALGGTMGHYEIHSTLGQAVTGTQEAGDHYLTSGFWTQVMETIEHWLNFLPAIFR